MNDFTGAKPKILFLTGMFRSGTTLTSRFLSAHPEVQVVYQLFFPFFKMWSGLFLDRVIQKSDISNHHAGSDALFQSDIFRIFVESGNKTYFSRNNIKKLKKPMVNELYIDPKEKPVVYSDLFENLSKGNAEDVLCQLILRAKLACGADKHIFGFKEIWCENFLPLLLNFGKINIKCVQMLRDPRAIFASRNTGRYLKECGNKKYPLLFIVESWKHGIDISRMLAGNASFRHLKYEDLINDPEGTANNLCSFLGVDFFTDMIDPDKFISGKGRKWRPNTTGDARSFSFNKEPLSYWETVLSDEEIGSIEFLCSAEMESIGYKPKFTHRKAEQCFLNYKETADDIRSWLRDLDYTCSEERKAVEMEKLENTREDKY